MRDLCINRNNHQKPTFHPLGDFLNPVLALKKVKAILRDGQKTKLYQSEIADRDD
jgi:hypothetical protein